MQLGISINLYDGIELLEYQISQIREDVDYILVHYQMHSWYGKPLSSENQFLLDRLKKLGLADRFLLYPIQEFARTPAEAKILERDKRNISRLLCYENSCTHFIDMDCDEFYKKEDFKKAKQFVIDGNYDFTSVKLIDYFHLPIFKKKNFNSCNVPFICKIIPERMLGGSSSLGKTDPTRSYTVYPWEKSYIFPPDYFVCHHMAGIRKNLQLKYAATSRGKLDRNRIPEIIENIKSIDEESIKNGTIQNKFGNIGNEFEIVNNYFGLPLEDFK